MAIPKIDPNVVHVSIGQLRRTKEADLTLRTYVVSDGTGPLAVCVPYEAFLEMQNALQVAPPILPLPQGGPVTGSSARGYDPALGARVPGGAAPDSPLRGV